MRAWDDEFMLLPPRRSARVEPHRGAARWRRVHPTVGTHASKGTRGGAVALLFLLASDRSPRGSQSLRREWKREAKKGKWGLGFAWPSDENGWLMAIGPTGATQASVAFHWPRPAGRPGDGGCASEVSKRSWAERFWANFTSRTVKEELFFLFSC
jgi:hypothetical protein